MQLQFISTCFDLFFSPIHPFLAGRKTNAGSFQNRCRTSRRKGAGAPTQHAAPQIQDSIISPQMAIYYRLRTAINSLSKCNCVSLGGRAGRSMLAHSHMRGVPVAARPIPIHLGHFLLNSFQKKPTDDQYLTLTFAVCHYAEGHASNAW